MEGMDKELLFLDALTDVMGDSEGQTSEEIKEELRADGVDVDGMLGNLMDFVKDVSMHPWNFP